MRAVRGPHPREWSPGVRAVDSTAALTPLTERQGLEGVEDTIMQRVCFECGSNIPMGAILPKAPRAYAISAVVESSSVTFRDELGLPAAYSGRVRVVKYRRACADPNCAEFAGELQQ